MPGMTGCIYCRTKSSAKRFARPEHVIPRAFGKFVSNLTIFCVCGECNQWFGDNLEVSFTRNSGEAVMRLLLGVKPSSEASDIRGDRIDITAGEGAKFSGGRSSFAQHVDGTTLVATFEPQVGFAPTPDAEPVLYREADLTSEIVLRYDGQECFVIGHTEDDYQRIVRRLSELGCRAETALWWHPDTSLPLVSERVNVDYRLDEGVFRTVGKIAFNYLAYVVGADFCLSTDFDVFRQYVRHGKGNWQSFISISREAALLDDCGTRTTQTRGHLLSVDWPRDVETPTASVMLFNDIHYRVRFASHVRGLWRNIKRGHHFNIKTLRIDPI
jgi:hypothetical protein